MNKTKKRGRKSNMPDKEYFETLYYNDNVSAAELAKVFEVKEQTIYNWAYRFKQMSNKMDTIKDLSDKQIFTCSTKNNNNIKKERSKIS